MCVPRAFNMNKEQFWIMLWEGYQAEWTRTGDEVSRLRTGDEVTAHQDISTLLQDASNEQPLGKDCKHTLFVANILCRNIWCTDVPM